MIMTLKQNKLTIFRSGGSHVITLVKEVIDYHGLEPGDEVGVEWDREYGRYIIVLPLVDEDGKTKITKNMKKIVRLVTENHHMITYQLADLIEANHMDVGDRYQYIAEMVRTKLLSYDKDRKVVVGTRAIK